MHNFSVSVTGDVGTDTYTRYIAGPLPESEEGFSREVSYDLPVPSGARLHHFVFETLLKDDQITAFKCTPDTETLTQSLQFLQSYQRDGREILRISKSVPLRLPACGADEPAKRASFGDTSDSPDMLVIHDATPDWRTWEESGQVVEALFSKRKGHKRPEVPFAIVILDGGIPQLRIDRSGTAFIHGKPSRIWSTLAKHRDEVAVICSAPSLRHAGAAISRRLSWEQGIEDVLNDLEHFQPLNALSQFRHLFIRVGFVGAIHIERLLQADAHTSLSGKLVFTPSARGGIFADETKEGRIQCQNSLIATCLIRLAKECILGDKEMRRSDVADALKRALTAGMRLYEHGFPCPSTVKAGPAAGDEFLTSYLQLRDKSGKTSNDIRRIISSDYEPLIAELRIPRDRIFGCIDLPTMPFDPRKAKSWEILPAQLLKQEASRINLGIAICKFGHHEVLNRPFDGASAAAGSWKVNIDDLIDVLKQPDCILSAKETPDEEPLQTGSRAAVPQPTHYRPKPKKPRALFVPTFEAANLVAIERPEIEAIRSIQNLIYWYVESKGQTPASRRPISVAVFGAPGSGKSFAIKQIAKSINDSITNDYERIELVECNVAQFRSLEDLSRAITRIASLNNERKIPLVFFDEFDCAFQGQPLGWLKYFLAPMQDGTFYEASQTITFGRAIFVFAGGIYQTIADFDPFTESSDSNSIEKLEERRKRQKAFRKQKGPDFVSRLRGHINILSLNPDATAPKGDDGKPVKPVLRRALTLRGQILEAQRFVIRDGCKIANVDSDVLYAFLTVENYRHGTRSMEAILQMCTPIDGVIEKASLPSRAQLNMHVDADDFMVRVLRGRFRRFLEPEDYAKQGTGDQAPPGVRPKKAADEAATLDEASRLEGNPSPESEPQDPVDQGAKKEDAKQGRAD
jgi:hypothetical protein